MILLRLVLFPFSVLFDLVTSVRNRMYDQGLKPSVRFDTPVVGVGNLTVGGTGKTPLTEYLIRLLQELNVATLSRGYGRKTKGFRIANPTDNAATLGDEPYQFYKKFGDHVVVAVGEDRALAIPNILDVHPATGVIVLDDSFQHRRVRPSLNILLSDFARPFYQDFLLPAGRLRESRKGAARADAVVVTKCPSSLSDDDMMEIEKSIRAYVTKPVFFSRIHYGNPVAYQNHVLPLGEEVALISGLSNPRPLEEYLGQSLTLVKHFKFGDHHDYSVSDIQKFVRFRREHPKASLITTEKDVVKLAEPEFQLLLEGVPLFYLPIELEFIKSGRDFDALVLNSIRREG